MKGGFGLNDFNQELKITSAKDRVFKEIFCDERNSDLLASLVETCLDVRIKNIKYLNNEIPQGNYQIKGKKVDVLLDTDQGKINIELNAQKQTFTNARNFSYISSIYIRNTLVGNDYSEDINIIQINLTFGLGEKNNDTKDDVYSKYMVLKCAKRNIQEKFIKNLIIYEFDMDKIMEFWYSKDEKMIDKYKYLIMLGLDSQELKELASRDKRVERYKMKLDEVTVSIGINDWIDEETDERMIRNTIRKEGRKEGIKEGIEKKQKEMIINLNKLNTPIDVIAKASGLTKEEVQKIIDDNDKSEFLK